MPGSFVDFSGCVSRVCRKDFKFFMAEVKALTKKEIIKDIITHASDLVYILLKMVKCRPFLLDLIGLTE